jgi:hypothetical protein
MKLILSLAAVAAVLVAFQNARAVEDPPVQHMQLVELEQQTPYLEGYAATNTAGTATLSIIRRVGNSGGVVFSSQAYAQFDNHNADGSRATFPLDVEDGDTYGLSVSMVKGPNFGIVQLFIDGRQVGAESYDLYAPALTLAAPVSIGTVALAEGKHNFTMKVIGKNTASTDYLGGLDVMSLDSAAAPQATPTAVATAEVGAAVPTTLALTVGAASFPAFVPGVEREYTATAPASVVSSAGDATLTVSDPGRLMNGSRMLVEPLQVTFSKSAWTGPVSNDPVTVTFKQKIGANEPLRTGTYSKTLTFTLSTTNP